MDKTARRLLRSDSDMLRACLACLALAGLVVAATGCSNNGEGERCSVQSYGTGPNGENGNDDCEQGLVCTPASKLNSNSDLCCPPDPRLATKPECIPGSGGATQDAGVDGDAAAPDADAATPDADAAAPDADAAAPDADADVSTEASPEAAPEASTEASTDAPAEAAAEASADATTD